MTSLAQVRELVTKEIQLKKAVGVARLLGDAEHDERTDHPGNGSARSESGNLHVASRVRVETHVRDTVVVADLDSAIRITLVIVVDADTHHRAVELHCRFGYHRHEKTPQS